MKVRAIKGYATEENVAFLTGDVFKIIRQEEGIIELEGIAGWCEGIEYCFSPKIVAEHFEVIGISYTI